MDFLIVGIDPGTTLGYAVLNLKGDKLNIDSSKKLNLNKLISKIINIGKPLAIGCDVSPAPSFVENFSVKTGSKLIEPDTDLTIKEKKELTKKYRLKNDHQRDALASSLYAYKILKPLLDKIRKRLKQLNKQDLFDKVAQTVIKNNISIKSAVNKIEKPDFTTKKKPPKKKPKPKLTISKFKKLKSRLDTAEKDITELTRQNQRLKKQNKKLLKKGSKLISKKKIPQKLSQKEKTIKFLDKKIKQKNSLMQENQKQISCLNNFISRIDKNKVLLKKLDNLGYDEFKAKEKRLNITEKDLLLIEDADIHSEKTIQELKDKISILIVKNIGKRHKLPFSIIKAKDIDIFEIKFYALADKKQIEKELKKLNILDQVITQYRQER
ncbi:DUF460 domain-containing protein [Candidatus Woesearchaeota archaeon]|nr:DUF460 domain-containing protein [Candidatus Woesearchaeota archaeon]